MSIQRRDYLCFPAFFPITILINRLGKSSSFTENVRLDAYRTDAIQKLLNLVGDRAYKQPTARFASTVDQAIFALSFEQLYDAEHNSGRAASLASPLYKWGKESVIIQLILPLAILATALVTINEPTTVPSALMPLLGTYAESANIFAGEHKPIIQVATGILLAIMPALPKSGLQIARNRFLKK